MGIADGGLRIAACHSTPFSPSCFPLFPFFSYLYPSGPDFFVIACQDDTWQWPLRWAGENAAVFDGKATVVTGTMHLLVFCPVHHRTGQVRTLLAVSDEAVR